MAHRDGRKAGKKSPGKRICILNEGHATEYEYLEALRTRLGISKDLVHVDHTSGYADIVPLAKYALRKASRRSKFDEWWIVADSEGKEQDVREAQSLVAGHRNVHLAVSRPCFEIWPILHLRHSTRLYNSSRTCQKDLDALLPGYLAGKKHLERYMPRLLDSVPDAVRYVRQLREDGRGIGNPPPTDVDLLVTRLNEQAAPGDAFDL